MEGLGRQQAASLRGSTKGQFSTLPPVSMHYFGEWAETKVLAVLNLAQAKAVFYSVLFLGM